MCPGSFPMTEKAQKRKENRNEFRVEVLEAFAALITAAFGLVAALAWNEAIKTTIDNFFDKSLEVTLGQFGALYFYAIIVTLIAVLFTIWIARASKKAKLLLVDEENE
jgi:predicted MFS family arabinose efflux permease